METAIIQGTSVLAQGLLINVITKLYSKIKSEHNSHISKIIDELDLKIDIEITKALLEDIKMLDKNKYHVVQICIQHIYKILNSISEEIDNMNLKLIKQQYNYTNNHNWPVYLWYYNSPNYESNKLNLKKYKDLLNKRVNTLIKILSIQNNICSKENNEEDNYYDNKEY